MNEEQAANYKKQVLAGIEAEREQQKKAGTYDPNRKYQLNNVAPDPNQGRFAPKGIHHYFDADGVQFPDDTARVMENGAYY